MRHYEVVVIVHPDQSDQVGAMISHYSKIVTGLGGTMHRVEDWGRRIMAYSINKIHKAHYVLMNIECNDQAMKELLHTFRFSDAVLRHLSIRMDKAITTPSPMMKEKEKEQSRRTTEVGDTAEAVEIPAPEALAAEPS